MTPPPTVPARRTQKVMVRFLGHEWAAIMACRPPHVPPSVFVRTLALTAAGTPPPAAPCTLADLRRATVLLIACLSEDITLEQAGELFDRWAGAPEDGRAGDGGADEGDD